MSNVTPEDREEYAERRALAMEMLEAVRTPAEAARLLASVGAGLEAADTLFHLGCNPHISFGDLEALL